MKSILFIAPSSFPVTGAESIVNIKLLQALSISGYFDIDLVSKINKRQDYPSDSLNDYGIKLRSINMIEVENVLNLRTIFGHFCSLIRFGLSFKGAHWAVAALPIIKKLLKENEYDYVLTKNSPSFLLGYYVKKHYKLKWVATWNDPFPNVKYPFPYGNGKNSICSLSDSISISIMKKYADVHIFPNPRLRDYMMAYLKVPIQRTAIVPHVVLNVTPRLQKSHSVLRLLHSGNLQSPRNPSSLFSALHQFLYLVPDAKICLSIMGVIDDSSLYIIKELNLDRYVSIIEPVSYQKSIDCLSEYDVAVIIEAHCEEGIFLPTKVSDFMQCGKPIFSLSPIDGYLNDLYKQKNIPYFANVVDEKSIINSLTEIYFDWVQEKLKQNITPESFLEKDIVDKYKSL